MRVSTKFVLPLATLLFGLLFVPRAAVAQAAVGEVRGPIWILVPTSAKPLQSIRVKAPATGNITVTVTGTVNYQHTLGTQGYYCLQLSQTSGYIGGCTPNGGSDSAIRSFIASGFPTTVPNYGALAQYSIVRTWPVTSGATYTFYLNGYQTNLNNSWLFQPAITALYVPGTLLP
jgi:hypothetical protein